MASARNVYLSAWHARVRPRQDHLRGGRTEHGSGYSSKRGRLLLRAATGPLTLTDVKDVQTVACLLMVWWGLSALAEPQHPVVHLMRHFGGHPFKADNRVEAVIRCLDQIHGRITREGWEMWKWAEREMSLYGA